MWSTGCPVKTIHRCGAPQTITRNFLDIPLEQDSFFQNPKLRLMVRYHDQRQERGYEMRILCVMIIAMWWCLERYICWLMYGIMVGINLSCTFYTLHMLLYFSGWNDRSMRIRSIWFTSDSLAAHFVSGSIAPDRNSPNRKRRSHVYIQHLFGRRKWETVV